MDSQEELDEVYDGTAEIIDRYHKILDAYHYIGMMTVRF